MKLNQSKCKYMIFTRAETEFATRLSLKSVVLDRIKEIQLLGVWITEDLSWNRNCQDICQKAYSRLSMITKLKYAGDLLETYKLFIRSVK